MKLFKILMMLVTFAVCSQNPDRFKDEVLGIQKKYDSVWDASKKTIVFTGSSSIRIWDDLNQRFPGHQIVNSGFGSSQATDLLAYTDELILGFNPYKVFIYEGDNDIGYDKRPKEIVATTKMIIERIRSMNKEVIIVLISAKPSIARWHLKRKYKSLNRKFKKMGKRDDNIQYANIWEPMLHGNKLNESIFNEDGLHMNSKGYDIWYSVLDPFINN